MAKAKEKSKKDEKKPKAIDKVKSDKKKTK